MVPNFESFMLPYLLCLKDGKEHTMSELTDYCAHYFKLSREDREERTKKGNNTKLYDRTQWSGTYMRKALLVESVKRGTYKITDRGSELLSTSPSHIDKKILSQYPEFIDFSTKKKHGQLSQMLQDEQMSLEEKTPSEKMSDAYNVISETLADELLIYVKRQSPKFFEKLVIRLLVAMGYGGSFEDAANVTQYSRDEGIDGVIKEDRLGLDKIYVQAKRYDSGVVGRKEIQSFVGALSGKGATKGIFITTSSFTKDALEYLPSSNIKIVLIDGAKLANYMIDYNIGVSVKQVYEIKRIDSDFFNEE